MTNQKPLHSPADVTALAERLKRLDYTDRAETPFEEPPSFTLATGLEHLQDSSVEYLDHLGTLLAAETPRDIEDALV